ncbi:hypothetical protein ACUN0C_13280 [Faunimonas sp. B44]|uniref:hypothetical protein n=1 Tax=Faunimonas sp. B44 TaxID=3461493 RepID=UPI004043D7D8
MRREEAAALLELVRDDRQPCPPINEQTIAAGLARVLSRQQEELAPAPLPLPKTG